MPSKFFSSAYERRRRPQTSTFSTVPPELRMTLRNCSNEGAIVRSSRSGARMTISSQLRPAKRTPAVLGGHGRSVTGGRSTYQLVCCLRRYQATKLGGQDTGASVDNLAGL